MSSSFLSQNEIEQLLSRLNPGMSAGRREEAAEPVEPLLPHGEVALPAREVERVEFPELQASAPSGIKRPMSLFRPVPVRVAIELGAATLNVREVLALRKNSLIKLEKLAGENVALLVNGRPLASGEVLVINENFGFRVVSMVAREAKEKEQD